MKIFIREQQTIKNIQKLSIKDLKNATKDKLYGECDERLKNFIDCLTERKITANDNIAFKSNIYENILKARNNKYVSVVGLKEHMVVYLASGKSCHASQVFSKQGGKGTRPVLEIILKNSESVCKFKAPENITLFFSFDKYTNTVKVPQNRRPQSEKNSCHSCLQYLVLFARRTQNVKTHQHTGYIRTNTCRTKMLSVKI